MTIKNNEASSNASFSRRNMLLAGTTLAAVSALASAAPVRTAQAQASNSPRLPPPASGRTSSSSSATISGRPMSAPIRSG